VINLNDVAEGGETEFIELNKTFILKQGQVVFWNNLHSNNSVKHKTIHQAHPVTKGHKAVVTK